MRGIYTAAFLKRLSGYFAKMRKVEALDIGKGFDLISGTSTGAIVACAAAIGRPMAELEKMYWDHGHQIFPHRISGKRAAICRAFFGGRRFVKAGDSALRTALESVLKDITLGEVYRRRNIALSIPAVAMKNHQSYVFKKTATSGPRDEDFRLADICLASSAAPIYRSLAAIKDPASSLKGAAPIVFADGGLWANNPVLVGMLDALLSAPQGSEIQIFSLGTCPRPEGDHISSNEAHRTMLEWWLGAKVAPISIAAQEYAYDNMARMFAGVLTNQGRNVTSVRFPKSTIPATTMDYLDLDDCRKAAINRLISQAASDADATKSACDDPMNTTGQLIKAAFANMPTMHSNGIRW